jgi:hypothetical protein
MTSCPVFSVLLWAKDFLRLVLLVTFHSYPMTNPWIHALSAAMGRPRDTSQGRCTEPEAAELLAATPAGEIYLQELPHQILVKERSIKHFCTVAHNLLIC